MVSARNVWDHDLPFGMHIEKKREKKCLHFESFTAKVSETYQQTTQRGEKKVLWPGVEPWTTYLRCYRLDYCATSPNVKQHC